MGFRSIPTRPEHLFTSAPRLLIFFQAGHGTSWVVTNRVHQGADNVKSESRLTTIKGFLPRFPLRILQCESESLPLAVVFLFYFFPLNFSFQFNSKCTGSMKAYFAFSWPPMHKDSKKENKTTAKVLGGSLLLRNSHQEGEDRRVRRSLQLQSWDRDLSATSSCWAGMHWFLYISIKTVVSGKVGIRVVS